MRQVDKSKQEAGWSRSTYKKREDFLRWLMAENARNRQMKQTKIAQADFDISEALMISADDGGVTG